MVQVSVGCTICGGRGNIHGVPPVTCPHCEGTGVQKGAMWVDLSDLQDGINDLRNKLNDLIEKFEESTEA